ncbi:hypothetical protein DSM104299_04021 [Baekduia alba]|nr:hypothetical protein DSM104299_04021 [Baekduia alba]
MEEDVPDDAAARYAVAHAELLDGLADGGAWLTSAYRSDALARTAGEDRALARRWRDLAGSAGAMADPAWHATRECADVWAGAEAGAGRVERLLILHGVATLRIAIATCVLGALADRPERALDARRLLLDEAAIACRQQEAVRALVEGAAPLRGAVAVSHAEAALSAYWDLLEELALAAVVQRPLLAA